MVFIGIDHNLLYDDFRVNHDDLQYVLAWGEPPEGSIEPAKVVEHFIATW